MKKIYADNAATTKLSAQVLDEMMPYLTDNFGNPSSPYSMGWEAKKAIETAREKVAVALNALPTEIYFTSGGSEANNWAIKGALESLIKKGKNHIITTAFEHHAVLHPVEYLTKHGCEVTYLSVNENGIIDLNELENAINDKTALVSIMFANNEIGTVQPVKEIGALCKDKGVLFHTDAVQAVGNLSVDVKAMNIDLLSLSAHKLHGPKGTGALYIRKGLSIGTIIDGGAQERGKRAGTENVAGIAGLGRAIEIAAETLEARSQKLLKMREKLIDGLLNIERSRLNGDRERRLPGNINICFEGIEGEALLLSLDLNGICASSGSACTSGSLDPSHVLLAIGLPHEIAHGSLRLSLGDENTDEDIDYILEKVPQVVANLRSFSPVWNKL